MRKVLVIIRITLTVILCIILLINLYMIISKLVFKQKLPKVLGFSQATVISGSMEPVFSVGDMLIFKERSKYEIEDIVLFESGNTYVTHRIIDESEGTFTTKGDANNTKDEEPLLPSNIHGELVLVIPFIGLVLDFFKTPLGIMILVIVGISLYEIPILLEKRKEKRVKS